MAARSKKTDDVGVSIQAIEARQITFHLIGETPLYLNRQSEKAKRQLLLPPLPTNKAARSQTLKHNPIEEFQASCYCNRREGEDAPTWLHLPGGMFKKCISSAALDIPGASKAQIGRLVSMPMTKIDVYGMPYMKADMVRQAGPSKTPDVRFRAILPEWAVAVTYNYIPAIIQPNSIANLLNAAGLIIAVGDYRVEKGAGDFGQFRIVPEGHAEWKEVVANGGRAVQLTAWEHPQYYDDDTRELVEWFDEEIERRQNMPLSAVVAEDDDEPEDKAA